MTHTPSIRAQVITRRTYNRPLNKEGTVFENWAETVDRVISHQKWLWERQLGRRLKKNGPQMKELEELRGLMMERKISTAGRTLWLGGTEVAKRREASQFNCAATHVESVYDVVDVIWLLLQGCGVGFRPIVGQLTGYKKPIEKLTIIRSERTGKGGEEHNTETFEDGVWTLRVGDSAEAWAKFIGKLVAHKYPARELVLDFSQIRPAGERLAGYGWISSGDGALAKACEAIHKLLNRRSGDQLSRIDILDLVNWLGTVLSSRRSAEIALFVYGEDEWEDFTTAKRDYYINNPQRGQSNNSLLFQHKPTVQEIRNILDMMVESGGSEPGFINGQAAVARAPWFKAVNPCAEILLGNKSFCNLVETDLGKFVGDSHGLQRAIWISARACYRQTCVNLQDGILQEAWHLNNDHLRLLGVGLTGVARRPDLSPYAYEQLKREAIYAGYSMADELGTPRPKNITTIKPSGTVSKIMDTTEGVHKPLGRFIINNVVFSKHDPLVSQMKNANYKTMDHPTDPDSVIVSLPVEWTGVKFDKVKKIINGVPQVLEVNLDSAIKQLEQYKMLQTHWCQQNVSCTVSYSPEEVPEIAQWLHDNWEFYVGVSFLFRADPTKTAKDLGYPYLPQEVITEAQYRDYTDNLLPLDIDAANSFDELVGETCVTGACPMK